jgi:hypothetical protein
LSILDASRRRDDIEMPRKDREVLARITLDCFLEDALDAFGWKFQSLNRSAEGTSGFLAGSHHGHRFRQKPVGKRDLDHSIIANVLGKLASSLLNEAFELFL